MWKKPANERNGVLKAKLGISRISSAFRWLTAAAVISSTSSWVVWSLNMKWDNQHPLGCIISHFFFSWTEKNKKNFSIPSVVVVSPAGWSEIVDVVVAVVSYGWAEDVTAATEHTHTRERASRLSTRHKVNTRWDREKRNSAVVAVALCLFFSLFLCAHMLMIGLLLWRDVIHISLLRPCIAHSFISLLKERELQVKLSTGTALNTENTLTLTRIFTTVVQLRHRIASHRPEILCAALSWVRKSSTRPITKLRVGSESATLSQFPRKSSTSSSDNIHNLSGVSQTRSWHRTTRKKAASQQHQLLLSWL